MAFTEGSSDGVLNGTTVVELVAAPAAATRRLVRTISIYNTDTVAVTVKLGLKNTSGSTTRYFAAVTLAVGDVLYFSEGDVVVLDATTKSIIAVLSAAKTTNDPQFVCAWGDVS